MRLKNGQDLSGEIEYICGGNGYKERDAYLELPQLKAGDYLFYLEIDWDENTVNRSVCATCYGASRVAFEADWSEKYSKEEVLRTAFTAKALGGNFAEVKVRDMASKGAPNIRRYQSTK